MEGNIGGLTSAPPHSMGQKSWSSVDTFLSFPFPLPFFPAVGAGSRAGGGGVNPSTTSSRVSWSDVANT